MYIHLRVCVCVCVCVCMRNLCCKQVKQTKTFHSCRTKETFQIFHNLTCKSEKLIYLLQCCICQFY